MEYWHVETDYLALILFILMLFKRYRLPHDKSMRDHMFHVVLIFSIIACIIDICSSIAMNKDDNYILYQVTFFLYIATMPILSIAWECYAIVLANAHDVYRARRMIALSLIPYIIYLILVCSNHWTRLFYFISPTLQYTRGPLFVPVGVGIIVCYLLAATSITLKNRHHFDSHTNVILMISFFIGSIIAMCLQLANPGWLIINGAYGIIYIFCDMTIEEERRKRLYATIERQNVSLRKAMALAEESSQAKSQFLARMSHEIRTPINAVIGIAQLEQQDLENHALNEDMIKEYSEEIISATQYLLTIINDVLDISKIESDEMKLSIEPLDVTHFIQNLNMMILSLSRSKGIDYQFEKTTQLADYYMADGIRIKQILMNLLNNAIKFTPQGGVVKLSISSLESNKKTTTLQFEVSDSGIGISKEFMSKLFTPFSQEYNNTTSPYGGTGLGLAISRQLARLMNGDISVKSTKGKGTVFTVSIKVGNCNQGDVPQESITVQDHYDFHHAHILLCEDNILNQQITKRLLENKGCEVICAENGQIGLDVFSQSEAGEYQMILMDIRMPVMDGLQATRAIRKLSREDAKSIPIVALSANAFGEDVKLSLDSGMNGHLAKHIDLHALYAKMDELITK